QAHERYVINFGQITLEEAARYPSLLSIVETRVKPERDLARETTADGAHRKKYWWQFAQPRPELFAAIRPLSRCLVASRHTKHLAFVFQRVDRVYSEATNVFVSERTSTFATLQSRVHEPWARLLSSSMRNDLRYSASDCFETFPFPKPNPCTVHPALEDAGQRLYDFRAVYMIDENVGLTITYNRLKDPSWDETRIVELRRLHEEMDREVLAAYGWGDVAVPPYCPVDQAERAAVRAFEDEVIDRLFVLNAKRAEDERALAMRQPASRAKLSRTAADSKLPAAKLQDKQPGGPQLGPERTDGSDRRSGG
ncbi:MAG: type IIL restriction-modification enzyme MmeI, partial [Polyangiaceae bacterium]